MATLGAATIVGRGSVGDRIAGGHLAAATLNAAGIITGGGHLAPAFLQATGSTLGITSRVGTLAIQLNQALLSGLGGFTVSGAAAFTLEACHCDARSGSDCYLTATGVVINNLGDGYLADCQFIAAGRVGVAGAYAQTTDEATVGGQGAASIVAGALALTLDDATFAATGFNPDFRPSAPGGVGRRKRHYLELDGQYFEVKDEADAIRIVKALNEAAREAAQATVKAAKSKPVVVPKLAVVKPDYSKEFTQKLQAQVDAANAELAAIYKAAAAQAEEDELAELLTLGIL